MAYGHRAEGGIGVVDVADRFFERLIYLKISNRGILMSDIDKARSLRLIADGDGISAEDLYKTQLHGVSNTMLDYSTGTINRGLDELKSLGLIGEDEGRLWLTGLGRDFLSFLHDGKRVDTWVAGIRYPEGSDAGQVASNITKLRKFIESMDGLKHEIRAE